MTVTGNPRDLHRGGACVAIDALTTTDELAVGGPWWIGEVDRTPVRTPRLKLEQLLEQLDVDR